ncbi:hypothetical protein [Roseibium sp. MMSF_3544]|uniref:hypothetical protein n=1 Tax=unclassified Roseibium TaxID=2629323 RepID=UPI00273EC713|nr:hypothetical protein [Roseibium sp. MMSF_3544]
MPDDDQIEQLLRLKFPLGGSTSRPERSSTVKSVVEKVEEQRNKAAKLRTKLKGLPAEEIEKQLSAEIEKQQSIKKAKLAEQERQRPYNQKGAKPDYNYWAKLSYWSSDECAALSLGRDPRVANWDAIKANTKTSEFAAAFEERREICARAATMGQLSASSAPSAFLTWANQMQVSVPDELVAAVEELETQISDQKSNHLPEHNRQQQSGKTLQEKHLATRERESLLKLVISMAIGGYGYDPKASRSSTAKDIASDLQQIGLSLDEDTVRKYLKEAKGLLPGDLTE